MSLRFLVQTPRRPVAVAFLDPEAPGETAGWAASLLAELAELLPEWPVQPLEGDEPDSLLIERHRGPRGRWLFTLHNRVPGEAGVTDNAVAAEGPEAAAEALAALLPLSLAQQDRRALLVTACALALPEGVLVLHGPAQSGKSCLALQCASLGVPLVADEQVLVTVSPEGLVEATALGLAPRPLRALPADAGAAYAAFVSGRVKREAASRLRLALARPGEQLAAGERRPVLGLVALERRPRGAIEFAPQGQGAALKALAARAQAPHLDAETYGRRLGKIVRRVPSWRLAFTSSQATARLLLERFGGR